MERKPFYPFRSARAKVEWEAHAITRAKAWPVPCTITRLETPSGRTFVRSCGRPSDPPLVLLPGARAGSLMWIDCVTALAWHYRVHALDIIDDVGFSLSRRTVSKAEDYVTWLDEVMTCLTPGRPFNLVGVSLGGAIAALYAARHPERLRSVVLMAPGRIVLPLAAGFFARLMMMCLPIPGRDGSALRRVCDWLFADAASGDEACRARYEKVVTDLETAVRAFALPRPPWPPVFHRGQWAAFRVPCLFMVGEHERIYSAQAAVRRLNRVAPHVKTEIIPGVGHDLITVNPDLVAARVLEFLADGWRADTAADAAGQARL
jgi:pimeloyl-ACP methyl ester carboxylesterase